jgi:hypothetical protein
VTAASTRPNERSANAQLHILGIPSTSHSLDAVSREVRDGRTPTPGPPRSPERAHKPIAQMDPRPVAASTRPPWPRCVNCGAVCPPSEDGLCDECWLDEPRSTRPLTERDTHRAGRTHVGSGRAPTGSAFSVGSFPRSVSGRRAASTRPLTERGKGLSRPRRLGTWGPDPSLSPRSVSGRATEER